METDTHSCMVTHVVQKEHCSDLIMENNLLINHVWGVLFRSKTDESGKLLWFTYDYLILYSDRVKDNIFQISYHGCICNGYFKSTIRKM